MPRTFLSNAGDILRSEKPINERLKDWCDLVSGFAGGGGVSILLFDHDAEDFLVKASTYKIRYEIPEIYFESKGTLEELALTEQRPIVLEELSSLKQGCRQGAVMLIPLISYGEPIGVLVVSAVTDAGFLQESQQAVFEAAKLMADTVGSLLREESVAMRMNKIAAINEAGVNIISTLDLSRLLKLVAASVCLLMEAYTCIIRLLDPETGKYGIREFHGPKTEEEQKALFLLDKKAVTRVLKGASPLLVRSISEDKEWKEFSNTARTMICFPLKANGDVIGAITVFDKFPHKTFSMSLFSEKDLAILSKLIQYAERAISNAIAYERSDKLRNIDELTGLPTLKYFRDRLTHEISRAKRFQRRLVLLVCEVHVRIHEGQPAGFGSREDQVFKRLAHSIRETLREYDVVARISDTKFGMIFPEMNEGNVSTVTRIKAVIDSEVEQIREKVNGVSVNIRFGQATFPDEGDDHEKLIFKSNIIKP